MNKFFPELLTIDEACEILQITPNQMKTIMRQNRIAFIHIGTRTKRISKEALAEFINRSTVETPMKIDPGHRLILKSKIAHNRGRSLKTKQTR